jgi:hypothetical protein
MPRAHAACSEKDVIATSTTTLAIPRTIELKPMCSSHIRPLNLDSTAWQHLPRGVAVLSPVFGNVYCWRIRRSPLSTAKSIKGLALFVMVLFSIVQVAAQEAQPASSTQAPLTLTLQDALNRARANSVAFQAALTDQGIAHEDKVQARAGLLPSVNYNNQFIYTEPNGTPSGVFVANNSVHE